MGKKTVAAKTTDMTVWDAELAAAAEASAKLAAEQSGGGAKSISIRGGVMTIDGNPVPGNTIVGVVAGFTMLNKYFEDDFDPDNPSSPVCYAYGQKKEEMGPHDESETPQHEQCTGCPQNEFGTADKGKGKACKNTFLLLVRPTGDYDAKADQFDAPESAEDLDSGEEGFYSLSVSPVNLKAWSGYVAKLASNLRPPWACYTKITAAADPKKQVALSFAPAGNAASDLLKTLKEWNVEAMKTIEQPFPKNSEREEREEKPAKKSNKPAKRRF